MKASGLRYVLWYLTKAGCADHLSASASSYTQQGSRDPRLRGEEGSRALIRAPRSASRGLADASGGLRARATHQPPRGPCSHGRRAQLGLAAARTHAARCTYAGIRWNRTPYACLHGSHSALHLLCSDTALRSTPCDLVEHAPVTPPHPVSLDWNAFSCGRASLWLSLFLLCALSWPFCLPSEICIIIICEYYKSPTVL